MNDQTWIFGKAISPLFADRVTNILDVVSTSGDEKLIIKFMWPYCEIYPIAKRKVFTYMYKI